MLPKQWASEKLHVSGSGPGALSSVLYIMSKCSMVHNHRHLYHIVIGVTALLIPCRYQYFLQLKQDILTGRWVGCPYLHWFSSTLAHCSSDLTDSTCPALWHTTLIVAAIYKSFVFPIDPNESMSWLVCLICGPQTALPTQHCRAPGVLLCSM